MLGLSPMQKTSSIVILGSCGVPGSLGGKTDGHQSGGSPSKPCFYLRRFHQKVVVLHRNIAVPHALPATGTGSHSQVFRAVERATGREVAVKAVNTDTGGWLDRGRRHLAFLREEISVHQEVSGHPFVVDLVGVFEDPEACYIVEELADGGSLLDHLHSRESMGTEGEVCGFSIFEFQVVYPFLVLLARLGWIDPDRTLLVVDAICSCLRLWIEASRVLSRLQFATVHDNCHSACRRRLLLLVAGDKVIACREDHALLNVTSCAVVVSLRTSINLTWQKVRLLLRRLLEACRFLHHRRIVHRDIKVSRASGVAQRCVLPFM